MGKKKIKVLSVLPVLGQPRDSKRITMLQRGGFEVNVATFQREYHKGRVPDCEVKTLGKISHGQFLKRIFKIFYALPILRAEIKRCDIIYGSSPDMAYMAVIASLGLKKDIIVEVGDIRGLQVKSGLVGFFVRKVDAFFLRKCSLLVVTAKGFLDDYYRQWLKSKIPALILENKLESNYKIQAIKPSDNQLLTIGYFGLLRCEWSWQVLKELARQNPDKIRVMVAGYPISPTSIPEESDEINNIYYLGEYKSPDDLPSLYSNVDMVWACYPFPKETEWNWKWARTNRFYESLCYKKPMISLEGSGDSASVKEYKIGKVIPLASKDEVVEILKQINMEEIEYWINNVLKLPESHYVYSNEHDELKYAIMKILNRA